MEIRSSAFGHNEMIPPKYTCDGLDVNPPLEMVDIPPKAKTLALIVDDPDAPVGTWVHWVVYDIPVSTKIDESSVPGKQGINDFKKQEYGGPCPPSGKHRYFFKLYALDRELELQEGITKQELLQAVEDHILEQAELIGLYER